MAHETIEERLNDLEETIKANVAFDRKRDRSQGWINAVFMILWVTTIGSYCEYKKEEEENQIVFSDTAYLEQMQYKINKLERELIRLKSNIQ